MLFPQQRKVIFFLTYWAQISHFGARSCSLNHNLGCMCLRHHRTRPSPYQARSILSSLQRHLIEHGLHSPSPLPCSPPGSAALVPDSREPASPPVQQSLVRWDQRGPEQSLPVLWEMGAEDKQLSLLQHAPLALLLRDITPLLFQTARDKEAPNPKRQQHGIGKGEKKVAENLNAEALTLAAI